eukprot:maker-scaffold14_size734282-snap-gene-6.30 protein:Tk11310 transcript:maker-scaffold14_size734282-snap-gene-6.30-mRNA-1 annotation:"family transcriptional regulator"
MPGPMWKHSVKTLDQRLDLCRTQASVIERMEAKPDSTIRKEIFNNGNTMVEVAIRTKRASKAVPIHTKSRKVITHRHPTKPKAATSHGHPPKEKWSQLLSDSQDSSKSPSIASLPHFSQDTKSSKSKLTKPRKSVDEGDAIHGRFQSRTLQVFLNEMRAAINGQNDVKNVNKILDDLEYVALNIKPGKPPKSSPALPAQDVPKLPSPSGENLEDLLKVKNDQIQELKSMISRLTANNSDMLALLTQKVGLEDSLKVAKTANEELLRKLTTETKKSINLATKLSTAEQEIQRLRIVVKDLKSSLNIDLEQALRPKSSSQSGQFPDQSQTIDLMISEVEDNDPDEKDEQTDSAIHSESHPLSSELEHPQRILQAAKGMLVQGQDQASKFMAANLDLSETKADLGEEEDSTLDDRDDLPELKVKRNLDQSGLRRRADANLKAFLDRMRNQDTLNVTLPKIPSAKSFDDTLTTIHMSGTSDLDITKSLSESRFRKGLEQTDILSTDPEQN